MLIEQSPRRVSDVKDFPVSAHEHSHVLIHKIQRRQQNAYLWHWEAKETKAKRRPGLCASCSCWEKISDECLHGWQCEFLDQHSAWIIEMMGKRTRTTGPAYIARLLCKKNGLTKGAVVGKQISNWYAYRVRTGRIPRSKRQAVNVNNNNMDADDRDCMFFPWQCLFISSYS
jgi:hypothetical protein